MPYEMRVAMNVTDRAEYQRYREAMAPILARYGGGFRYDFIVGESLKSASPHPVTPVFAIFFADEPASAACFADPRYLEVKARHDAGSVAGHTVIAAYPRG
jgi:uncharacterized protein (DUF1330 family)